MSTDLDTPMTAELAQQQESIAEAAAAKKAERQANEPIQLPRLDVVSGSTNNPPKGAEHGQFYNNITNEVFGDQVEFLVVDSYEGRFYADDVLGSFRAVDTPIVPAHWPEKYRNKAFVDLDDTEEGFNRRIEAGEIKWEKGPPISTTINFVGFVIDPEPGIDFPLELSLMRANKPAGRVIKKLLTPFRNDWDRAVRLETDKRTYKPKNKDYYVVTAGVIGNEPTNEQRTKAVQLWSALQEAPKVPVGPEDKPEPAAKPAAVREEDGVDF